MFAITKNGRKIGDSHAGFGRPHLSSEVNCARDFFENAKTPYVRFMSDARVFVLTQLVSEL
jgi:hypothetical protein